MDRGSRIITCLQTLEKVSGSGLKSTKYGPEDLQHMRCSTGKILQYLQTQDKSQRDIVIKNGLYIDLLLSILENVRDTCTEQNLVLVLIELIGKSQTRSRVTTLVSHGASHILFSVLVQHAREPACSDDHLVLIHSLLAKLGQRDRKFAVKARLSQAQTVTLSLLRSYVSNPRTLQPVIHVLKLYSANAVNSSHLGKNGAVSYLFKVLAVSGRRHLTLCKHALDALALLVKSKSNSARAIGQGGVGVLLNMFYDWHKVDAKNRHVSLRKSILSVLRNITNLQCGRKALTEVDGVRVLYACCQDGADTREVETLVFMASTIMRKCFPKNRLPLASLRSPLSVRLPQSSFHVPDHGEGQGEENGYESSVDNDDDISSDDDGDGRKLESDEEATNVGTSGPPAKRTWDDLQQYRELFKELYQFDFILEEDELEVPAAHFPIVIPTALSSLSATNGRGVYGGTSGAKRSQSVGALHHGTTLAPSPRRSVSNHNASYLSPPEVDMFSAAFSDSVKINNNNLSKTSYEDGYTSSSRLVRERGFYMDTSNSDFSQGPSAVNLKTGSSVFSLDFPSTSMSSAPKAKKSSVTTATRSPKVKRKTSKGTKEKKKSKKPKDDWASFDPLKSLSVSAYGKENDGDDPDYGYHDNQEDQRYENPELYAEIAAKTKSVGRFNKIAYPDMYGHEPPPYKEPLYEKKFGTQRQKIFEDIDRFINPENTIDRTVYDLDALVATAGPTYCGNYSNHTNRDEIRVARQEEVSDHLKFNSQFECGNLRKAIQIRAHEYDLILSPDVNTNHHHQWFYFEVSHMEAGTKYRFNIVNCEKVNSQFNFGMKPVLFSVAEAMAGRPHWVRAASEICYYKNHFVRSAQTTGGVKGKSYYTTTFTVTFPHDRDVCYLAYHYPYTYSMMQYHLCRLSQSYDSGRIYLREDSLCETLGGNPIPVLTITSHPASYDRDGINQLKNRPYIFLSSRVHPGESNSSWVMKGTLSYLLSNKASAQQLRDMYIFKIVPMLNPDGVINGTHRCSLVAEDLNRRWLHPCPKLHPTIYHTKGLLQYLHMISKAPLVFCDYHGHSRKKNVFLYGCCPSLSWTADDTNNRDKMEDTSYKTLPRVLHSLAPAFSAHNCSFVVEKAKESTARVVVWREVGVVRSYTMESSYCGADQGPYKGLHLSTRELEEMGRRFCDALLKVKSRHAQGVPTDPSATNSMDTPPGDLMAYPCDDDDDDDGRGYGGSGRHHGEMDSLLGEDYEGAGPHRQRDYEGDSATSSGSEDDTGETPEDDDEGGHGHGREDSDGDDRGHSDRSHSPF